MSDNIKRRALEQEFLKLEAFKENWYALAACICSSKIRSRSHAFSLMGIKVMHEKGVSVSKNVEFDREQVQKLYKELGSVRQVAIKLGCSPSSIAYFFKKEKLEMFEERPKLSDDYDKNRIWELRNSGKTIREIAEVMGYTYPSLYKYIKANIA